MAFFNTWDLNTKKGKERIQRLLEIVQTLKHRDDLKPRLRGEKLFQGIKYQAVKQKLRRETEQDQSSDLGRAWSMIPIKQHIIIRLIPDEARRRKFAEDAGKEDMTVPKLLENYEELRGLNARVRAEIFMRLGVKRLLPGQAALHGRTVKPDKSAGPGAASYEWWLRLTPEQGQEFLADFRTDYRVQGNTNADYCEKWSRITGEPVSSNSLGKAARYFGETRNRVQIAAEIKTSEEVDKAIDVRLLSLIHANMLNTLGVPGLLEKIRDEFSKDLERACLTLSEERFMLKVDRLLWQDGPNTPLSELTERVRFNRSLKPFMTYHAYIPQAMIEAEARKITGLTNEIDREKVRARALSTIPGILRFAGKDGLKGGEDFEFPHISFQNPFVVPLANPQWKIMIVNGANIGIPFNREIEQNPTRQAFALAQHLGLDAIFIQNTLDLVTTKAQGPRRALEAKFSGREITLDVIDPIYREEVERILGDFSAGRPAELVYETASESLRNLMTGWRKNTRRPKYKNRPENKETVPEFNGKVFVQFGYKEEAIVASIAYGEALYETLVKQKEEREEHGMVSRAIKRNEKQITAFQNQISQLEQTRDQADVSGQEEITRQIGQISTEIERLTQENFGFEERASELKASFEVRFRISNIAPALWNLYMKKAFAFMVSLFEDPELGIPNCKVISSGSTYIKLGEETGEINIPGHLQVTEDLLAGYCNVYGPRVLRKEMADFTVICHPYALRYELTGREKDANGERGSALVFTAPICVDGEFVRSKLGGTVAKVHPIGRTVFNELFNPGVLVISSVKNAGKNIVVPNHYSIESLGVHEKKKAPAIVKSRGQRISIAGAYVWEEFATDQHWGGQSQASVDCEHCGINFDMGTAVFHAMRLAGYGNGENGTRLPPIHGYTANDDPTQGHHFDAEHMPHPHQLLYPDIEERMMEKFAEMQGARPIAQKYDCARWMMRFALHQIRIRGAYFATDQINLIFKSVLKPNIDMFDGILRRAVKAGLIVKGLSTFSDDPVVTSDTRDIGLTNWGTGNHMIKTTEGTLSEGPLYATNEREMLLQQPYWQERPKTVAQLVKAPLYGREFIAWGTMQAPDGYEYGCDYRNTPPGGVAWGAPLKATARNDLRRGNYSRIFEGKVTKKTCGDKHFLTFLLTSYAIYLMGPAGAHTDGYGELGFPPNNTGIVFLGTPAEGPAAGPVLLRPLLFDHIKRMMKDPRNFDWEAFLPNAL